MKPAPAAVPSSRRLRSLARRTRVGARARATGPPPDSGLGRPSPRRAFRRHGRVPLARVRRRRGRRDGSRASRRRLGRLLLARDGGLDRPRLRPRPRLRRARVGAPRRPRRPRAHPPAVVGGKILFGSQTGTARRLAHKLASSLRSRHGVALDVADLARYDPEDLAREPVALVLISTYEGAGGEPVPPESAAWFCRWARESSRDERYGMLHLVNVKFAVFGCGNREYGAERFNAAARALDADLARLGGERVLRRADGDEASGRMEEQFHDWADRVAERLKPKDEGATTGDEASSKGNKPIRSRRPERSSRASSRPPAAAPSLGEGPAKDDVTRGGSPTSVGDGRAYDTDADEEGEDGAGEDLSAGSEDDLDMEDIGGGSSASGERREMVTPRLRAALTKQGYKILGSHSGVKLCRWTKAQLRGRGGVTSTPSTASSRTGAWRRRPASRAPTSASFAGGTTRTRWGGSGGGRWTTRRRWSEAP